AVAFASFVGVLFPSVSSTTWIIAPFNLSDGYAISLSAQQLLAIGLILLLTLVNTRGLGLGKFIQNSFTLTKTLSLLALILLGVLVGSNAEAIHRNFADAWTPANASTIGAGLPFFPDVSAANGPMGLLVALCAAQVGSLFSSDSWNSITLTGGEVKEPKRNLPLALALGTGLVITLYILANVAYLIVLPIEKIQQ